MVVVALDGHAQGTGESLEDGLNLVMFIGAQCFDGEVYLCAVRETFEEMKNHLGGHVAYPLAF